MEEAERSERHWDRQFDALKREQEKMRTSIDKLTHSMTVQSSKINGIPKLEDELEVLTITQRLMQQRVDMMFKIMWGGGAIVATGVAFTVLKTIGLQVGA